MLKYWATLGAIDPAYPKYNVAGKVKVYLASDVDALLARHFNHWSDTALAPRKEGEG